MISVLLVHPVSENSRSPRSLLSSSGTTFKLNCVSSYQAILEGFRSKAYDVCLIDADMDTGLKLFAQARSLGWTAPIVMIASDDAGEALEAIRSGVADCLIRSQLSVAGIEHSLCCVVEQARSLELTKERERRYLALLDNSKQIVYTHDLKGTFLSINHAGELLIGYSQAELIGMNVWQLLAPGYQVLMTNMIARTLDAQSQMRDEVKLVTKYGGTLLVKLNMHPINQDGQTVEIQGMANPRAVFPKAGPWQSHRATEHDPSRLTPEDKGVSLHRPHQVSNSFPALESSPHSGRSLLTL
jgi:PAS domain S-box-containing protein